MKENISLLDLFSALDLGDEANALLKQNTVQNVDLRIKEREVVVCVRSEVYLPIHLLTRAEQCIRAFYDLRAVNLQPRYDAALLARMEIQDVTGLLAGLYPPAPAILAGCRWETEGSTLHIHLRANGITNLKPHLSRVEKWLSQCFCTAVHIELHAGRELSAEELFAETQRIRDEAKEHIPAPLGSPAVKPDAPKPQSAAEGMIFGKPFFQEPTPMRELNVDMFKVCVEGEVFAVNHKELT